MTLQYKLMMAFFVILALIGATTMVYSRGYHSRDTEVAQLNDKLIEIDRRTKEIVAKQEVTTHEITTQYEDDKSVLINYYSKRLLHTSKNTCPSPTADSAQGPDDTTAEPVSSGSSFEEGCALDALQVMKFQDWIKNNNFPVGE